MGLLRGLAMGSVILMTCGAYGFLAGRHHDPMIPDGSGGTGRLSKSVIVSAGQFVVPVENANGKLDALLLAEINLALPADSGATKTLTTTRAVLRNALLEGLFDLSAKGLFTEGMVTPKDLGTRLKHHLQAVYEDEVPIDDVLFDRLLLQTAASGPL